MIWLSGYRTARRGFRVAHAAPAGGACQQWRGRGCGFALISLFSIFPLAVAASAEPSAVRIAVPSGRQVSLQEVRLDDTPGALWARFRFLAPELGKAATVSEDIDDLCENFVLPYLAAHDLTPERVVISLADRVVPFGESDPDATQVFEAYRPEKIRCIWEGF